MQPKTRLLRILALTSFLALLVWVSLWQWVLREEQPYSSLFIFIAYVLPLLLPLKGMIQGKPYTHAWANFIALYYLLHSCTMIYVLPEERIYAVVELLLVVVMFSSCSLYARYRGRELGLGIGKLKDEMQAEKDAFSRVKK